MSNKNDSKKMSFSFVKYIHIMPHSSLIHNRSIVDMINSVTNDFNSLEHIFIIKNRAIYDELKDYNNVIFDSEITTLKMSTFSFYSNKCDYIFLHSNDLNIIQLLNIEKKILNKIIWCIWGHDLYSVRQPLNLKDGFQRICKNLIINISNKILNVVKIKISKQFYAVGIGFKYDVIEIRKLLGSEIPVLTLPYGYIENKFNEIQEIKYLTKSQIDKESPLKIMVGHSAYKFLNHIEILGKLSKFKNENIIISLVLSYGDSKYAEDVELLGKKIFENKIEIIRESMPYNNYLHYLNGVDICIFDNEHQSALGNIWRMLFFEKKMYLNKYGIVKTALLLEGVETYNVIDIENMEFEEFAKPIQNSQANTILGSYYLNEMTCVNMWQNALRELK